MADIHRRIEATRTSACDRLWSAFREAAARVMTFAARALREDEEYLQAGRGRLPSAFADATPPACCWSTRIGRFKWNKMTGGSWSPSAGAGRSWRPCWIRAVTIVTFQHAWESTVPIVTAKSTAPEDLPARSAGWRGPRLTSRTLRARGKVNRFFQAPAEAAVVRQAGVRPCIKSDPGAKPLWIKNCDGRRGRSGARGWTGNGKAANRLAPRVPRQRTLPPVCRRRPTHRYRPGRGGKLRAL